VLNHVLQKTLINISQRKLKGVVKFMIRGRIQTSA